MKRNNICQSTKDAVCFLILIHLTTSAISFECPKNVSNNCSCQTVPEFSLSCSNNNQKISINIIIENDKIIEKEIWEVKHYLKFDCTNDSDEEMYKLLNFEFPNNFNETGIGLKVNSCPTSVTTLIWRSILGNSYDFQDVQIITNSLTTLPANILQNQTNLFKFDIIGHNLTSLPESILYNRTNIDHISIIETDMMTLPANIFRHQTNLVWLNLDNNKLRKLPDNIFSSQTNLFFLSLSGNFVITLM